MPPLDKVANLHAATNWKSFKSNHFLGLYGAVEIELDQLLETVLSEIDVS